MDSNDDLQLSVPLQPLKDFFTCPVCMGLFSVTTMTPCGHRYCEKCILEWVERKHKCPCCNAVLRDFDLIRDTGFDGLINIVSKEKVKAEDAYFANLISKCNKTPAEGSDDDSVKEGEEGGSGEPVKEQDKQQDLSPVEQILQRHIRVGIVEHERYYRVLKGQFEQQVDDADEKLQQLEERDDDCQEEKQLWLRKKVVLEGEFHRCTKLLTNAYDKYLSEHLPSLSTLPVTVFVRLYGKKIIIGNMVLQPQYSLSDIKEAVFNRIRGQQDKVAVYHEENVHYLLVRPYAKGNIVVDEELVATILSSPDSSSCHKSDILCLLPKDCIPVLQYGIQPGSDIIIFGDIKLQSELPKQCFAVLFEEGEERMDYFTCKDCSFNWVCRSCKEFCHKDHMTTPYVMGHQPTWACCYCPRKKKCLLGHNWNGATAR